MKTCKHFKSDGVNGVNCQLHNFNCSFGVCANCKDNTATGDWWLDLRRSHKIGTKISKLTQSVGVKPCGGCRKRKDYLDGDI